MIGNVGRDLAFIVGHYKSGSTWLINLLSLHPSVCGVGETSLFSYATHHDDVRLIAHKLYTEGFWGRGSPGRQFRHRLAEYARPLRNRWKPTLAARDRPTIRMDLSLLDQVDLRRELLQSASKEDLCRRYFDFLRRALRARGYLVEKNNNIMLVPFIKGIFADAKLIAIYRDGRDVVVSERYFLKNEAGQDQRFDESVRRWREAMEAQFRYAEQYGICAVSYEEMLADGPAVARRLLDYLGLPDDDEVVGQMTRKSSFEFTTGRKSGQEKRSSFYRKGTAGDWVNHFSERDKAAFKDIAGDTLVRLGYERDHNW
jgi:hypothetical protein